LAIFLNGTPRIATAAIKRGAPQAKAGAPHFGGSRAGRGNASERTEIRDIGFAGLRPQHAVSVPVLTVRRAFMPMPVRGSSLTSQVSGTSSFMRANGSQQHMLVRCGYRVLPAQRAPSRWLWRQRRRELYEECHLHVMPSRFPLLKSAAIFLLLVFFPVGVSAGRYWFAESRGNWQTADSSSAGLLPLPSHHPEAVIRVYGARTVRWKAIFAIHTWIVVKDRNAATYTRYDYTAWGEPIRTNGFAADARWFGVAPETIAAVDGPEAGRLIPKIRHVIENYKFRTSGDYNAWPGPNSNTFVQAVLDAVPELKTVLPPTAIGKDYPYRGEWVGLTSSGTGVYASLGGYVGLTIGWVEGLEVNFLGAVVGLDIRRPALKLPGIGRLGMMAGI
jgi:hypothetical protein